MDDPPAMSGLFRIINNFTDALEHEIKENAHADEVIVKTKVKKNWYWGV